ncbi:MAG: uroporphyrinogen decarboxylase family protein [Anaerolineae bacterium]
MNDRERYRETLTFGCPDRVYYQPMWAWEETLERWYGEGMPRDAKFHEYFGTDTWGFCPVAGGPLGHLSGSAVIGLDPTFEIEVLEETPEYVVRTTLDGQVVRENKLRMNMPQYLDHPLKCRDDWEKKIKPRLNPHSPGREHDDWDKYVASVQERDYPLGIWAASFWGRLNLWCGVESLSYLFYDDPGLLREINEYLAWFVIESLHKLFDTVQVDFVFIWEDMGSKGGPLCSPKLFREFMLPGYKKVTQFFREHGVDIIQVDSDGNNYDIIPLWIEGGVTGLRPLEVAAGEDAVYLRKRYGKQLSLVGNIDKRALIEGKDAIDREVLSKVPWLLMQGGFIPQVDHLVPPDVTLANYWHYWNLVKQIAGDPERYLFEAKRLGYWAEE